MAKMFIGGESVDSVTKNTTEVRNPATGATVDTVPQGNDKDVQQAIQAAEEAFKVWSDVSPEDRGNALMNAGELIKKTPAEISQLLTQEQGKTLFEAGLEIHHLVHGLEFYAGLASKVRGSHVPLPQKGAYGMVVRQPIGVVRRHRAVELSVNVDGHQARSQHSPPATRSSLSRRARRRWQQSKLSS